VVANVVEQWVARRGALVVTPAREWAKALVQAVGVKGAPLANATSQ
jgi:hypothetical protein